MSCSEKVCPFTRDYKNSALCLSNCAWRVKMPNGEVECAIVILALERCQNLPNKHK